VLEALEAQGRTLAVAESLTGGSVCAALVAVPGASRVVRGAVVAYATELKRTLLGVDDRLLTLDGAVHPDVARAMAEGVRSALGADVGLATTGVAGPDPVEGQPVGTVFVAVASARGTRVTELALSGSRDQVRASAVTALLDLAARLVVSEQI